MGIQARAPEGLPWTDRTERTKQSFKDQCDINKIIRQYVRSGVVQHLSDSLGGYGDVSEIGDYREALHRVMEAERVFGALPADIRAHFGNDPAALLDAYTDPSRVGELRELGLLAPEAPPAPPGPPDPPVGGSEVPSDP